MEFSSLILTLPVWIGSFVERFRFPIETVEERMRFVIALAAENIKRKTGGPFAAALFDRTTGELIAPGVNRVQPLNCSIAHAEMMAIGIAQQRCDTYNLGATDGMNTELVTSTEPCAMCLGALPWSGIKNLVCGATDADARSTGFDEGAKSETWITDLAERGITTVTGICRTEAAEILKDYIAAGGCIYNGGAGEQAGSSAEQPKRYHRRTSTHPEDTAGISAEPKLT